MSKESSAEEKDGNDAADEEDDEEDDEAETNCKRKNRQGSSAKGWVPDE